MIRRSFRAGLTLGVLTGLAFALAKMLGARRPQPAVAPAADAPWPRLEPDPMPSATPPVAQPAPQAAPVPAPVPAAAPAPTETAPPAQPAPPAEAAPAAETAPSVPPASKAAAAKPVAAKKASATKKKPLVASWVEPTGGVCPTSHPVKGKLASKIFHLPGMLNYDRTRADRCYRDVTAAEKDGLRPAKR